MGAPGLSHAVAALGLCALTAVAAHAQAPAAPALQARAQMETHVFALVQEGKCGQAKAAALRGAAPDLAEQISEMCGVSASAAAPARQGGGRGARGGGGPPQGSVLTGAAHGGP